MVVVVGGGKGKVGEATRRVKDFGAAERPPSWPSQILLFLSMALVFVCDTATLNSSSRCGWSSFLFSFDKSVDVVAQFLSLFPVSIAPRPDTNLYLECVQQSSRETTRPSIFTYVSIPLASQRTVLETLLFTSLGNSRDTLAAVVNKVEKIYSS